MAMAIVDNSTLDQITDLIERPAELLATPPPS
jgi:hypothetical protein